MHTYAMNYDTLTALTLFALVSTMTPGPNNLMLMASGANFGVHRTIPHMLGVGLGFVFMVLMVGVGLVKIFEFYPVSYTVMKIVSVFYLLYLSWRIATAADIEESDVGAKPLTFVQAALFQWVNPKAWITCVTVVSVFSPEQAMAQVLIIGFVYLCAGFLSTTTWAVLGQQLRRLLTSPIKLRVFNTVMAILLVSTLYPVLFGNTV